MFNCKHTVALLTTGSYHFLYLVETVRYQNYVICEPQLRKSFSSKLTPLFSQSNSSNACCRPLCLLSHFCWPHHVVFAFCASSCGSSKQRSITEFSHHKLSVIAQSLGASFSPARLMLTIRFTAVPFMMVGTKSAALVPTRVLGGMTGFGKAKEPFSAQIQSTVH